MKRDIAVTEAVHLFDHTPPQIRRWFTDRADDVLAAAAHIREMRSLAHYTTVPWRHAAKAEKTNRTVSDGTRAALIQAALGEEWLRLRYCSGLRCTTDS